VLERGLLAERDLKAVDSENTARIDEAVKFAESSPLPDLEELYSEVYVPNGVA
jgi:TPP-dependent pyruvate/acetoin dehydrogenase alpha subunit